MRSNRWALLVLAAGLLAGGTAAPAPVMTDVVLRVDVGGAGTFSITDSGTVNLTGSGAIQGTTTGGALITGSRIEIPERLVELASPVVIAPGGTPVDAVTLLPPFFNQAATFASGGVTFQAPTERCGSPGAGDACVAGGALGGVMGIRGVVSADVGGIPAVVDLADLHLGRGGDFVANVFAGDAAPWTTGPARAATANGVDATTVTGAGSPLTFVTPVFLGVPLFGTALPVFVELELGNLRAGASVPEPETLCLLGAGLVGLALARRGASPPRRGVDGPASRSAARGDAASQGLG